MSDARPGSDRPAPGTPAGRPAGSAGSVGEPEPVPAGATAVDLDSDGADGVDGSHASDSPVGPFVAGLGLVAVGVLLLTQVFAIDADGFSPQGPRFFPLVVVTLLTVLGAVYVLQQALGLVRRTGLQPAERFTHMPAAAALLALLVAYAFVLGTVGYVIATAVFFVGSARAMGSRHLTRDVVVGIGLSLLVYLVFTRALGVFLPEGVLPL